MFNSIIGALRVNLGMNSAAFEKGSDAAEKRLKRLQKNIARIGANFQRAGARLSLGLTLPLVGLSSAAVAASKDQERAIAQVEAALASMGNQAGFTSTQLQEMASSLQGNSLFGDEEILDKVTANLLTFGNIADQEFSRAQQLALDLSARLDQDLKSSAIQLGKALNDPVEGITALSRVGVQFTEQQEAQIKAMARAGQVAEAQRLILSELEKQYRGQAAALAATDSGRLTQSLNRISDASEKIGAIVLPVLARLAEFAADLAEKFSNLSPRTQKIAVALAGITAALGPLIIGLGLFVSSISVLLPLIIAIAGPFALIAGTIGLVAGGFVLLKDGAEKATLPIYNASDAIATLNGDLIVFHNQRAPAAGKAAIDLANDYVRLAEEAYNAAEAQLAEKRARLEAGNALLNQNPLTANGNSGAAKEAAEAEAAALAELTKAERNLAEARRQQKRAITGVVGSTYDAAKATEVASDEVKVLVEGLDDLATSGGASSAAVDELKDALDDLEEPLTSAERLLESIFSGFSSQGISGAFDALRQSASDAFANVIKEGFGVGVPGGATGIFAGFKNIFSDLGGSLKTVASGIAGILGGGGLSGLGGVISAAVPLLGAASFLIKGIFGSKKITGQGFELGFDGDDLLGGQFTTIKRKRLFGLISSTRTSIQAFDDEVADALSDQFKSVQSSVQQIFKPLGVNVSDALISGVSFAVERFDTQGLSESEIEARFAEVFSKYGDALTDAIAGISLEAAATLSALTLLLQPVGQTFFGTLSNMADAATDLAQRFGGVSGLERAVSSFASSFLTEQEKLQVLGDQVSGVFGDLGIEVPNTIAAFKDLVISQNLMTEAGREAYAALLNIAPQFKAITDAASDFGSFDLSEKRFETQFEDQISQIVAARGYDADQAQLLGGSLEGASGETAIGLLQQIADSLEVIEVRSVAG